MGRAYTYTKSEAKRFIKRTKSGLQKMYNSNQITANTFVKMCNDLDRMMKKLA